MRIAGVITRISQPLTENERSWSGQVFNPDRSLRSKDCQRAQTILAGDVLYDIHVDGQYAIVLVNGDCLVCPEGVPNRLLAANCVGLIRDISSRERIQEDDIAVCLHRGNLGVHPEHRVTCYTMGPCNKPVDISLAFRTYEMSKAARTIPELFGVLTAAIHIRAILRPTLIRPGATNRVYSVHQLGGLVNTMQQKLMDADGPLRGKPLESIKLCVEKMRSEIDKLLGQGAEKESHE